MDTISNFLCVEKMGWSDAYVDVKSPNGKVVLGTNIKPKTAVGRIKKWLIEEGKLCTS